MDDNDIHNLLNCKIIANPKFENKIRNTVNEIYSSCLDASSQTVGSEKRLNKQLKRLKSITNFSEGIQELFLLIESSSDKDKKKLFKNFKEQKDECGKILKYRYYYELEGWIINFKYDSENNFLIMTRFNEFKQFKQKILKRW